MNEPVADKDKLPPLTRDSGFGGMVATQFLGAFNDNVLKQLVILYGIQLTVAAGHKSDYYTSIAMAVFSIPFVLLSGFAGYLADQSSKKTIFVICKIAEIGVATMGVLAFYCDSIWAALGVVFLMGIHSAFFGPAKYGIMPEMLRERDLPQANGLVQMTTFIAVILGAPFAGRLATYFAGEWWKGCLASVAIAVIGTSTALLVRRTPVARPNSRFTWDSLVGGLESWKLILSDRTLAGVLAVYAFFWFVAGVVNQSINSFAGVQLRAGEANTSDMAASVSVGIAIGCFLAGKFSEEKIRFGLVSIGAWGISLSLVAIAVLGASSIGQAPNGNLERAKPTPSAASETLEAPPILTSEATTTEPSSASAKSVDASVQWTVRYCQLILAIAGVFTGFMAVPLQVYLQVKPPGDCKGQIMGLMNLTTWTGILLSAAFSGAFMLVFVEKLHFRISYVFVACALMMLPLALFYRPADAPLK